MIAEGIDKLKALAVEAAGAKLLQLPGEPRKVLVVQGDGYTTEELPPPLRSHSLGTLDDLIEFALDHVQQPEADDATPSESRELGPVIRRRPAASIWYGPEAVSLLLDETDRREGASLTLTHSPTWETLDALAGETLDQGRLMRLLRVDFRDCLDAGRLLAALRRVEWSSQTRNVRDIRSTGESLGKSIEAEVQAVEQLPDTVLLTVPIYETEGERFAWPVECVLEADALSQRFRFHALPGRMAAAVSAHMDSIRERLAAGLRSGNGFGIYYGTP